MSVPKHKKQSMAGFTIVELIVGMTVISILFLGFITALTSFLAVISKNNATIDMSANSQNLLRNTVDAIRVGDGVRQTASITDNNAPAGGWNTNNASFVIVIASPALDSSHNYIIDPSTGSPYMNELVYYKEGTSLLERQLANPGAVGNTIKTSCPSGLATSSCPADKDLADYVQNMSFSLYDQDNINTSDPSLARSIKISLGMQRTVYGAVINLNNNIQVTLRNRF